MATLAQLLPSYADHSAILRCWGKIPAFVSSHITAVSGGAQGDSAITVRALFLSNEGEAIAECHPSEITVRLQDVSAWQFASFLRKENDHEIVPQRTDELVVEGAGFRILCRELEVLSCEKANLAVP